MTVVDWPFVGIEGIRQDPLDPHPATSVCTIE